MSLLNKGLSEEIVSKILKYIAQFNFEIEFNAREFDLKIILGWNYSNKHRLVELQEIQVADLSNNNRINVVEGLISDFNEKVMREVLNHGLFLNLQWIRTSDRKVPKLGLKELLVPLYSSVPDTEAALKKFEEIPVDENPS